MEEDRKNIAAVLHSAKDLRVEERAMDYKLTEDEVLLKMKSVGICGTDVHFWQNGRVGDYILKDPMVLGHEPSGLVVEVGSNVKKLKVGDRVTVEPGIPCRLCEFCLNGRYNLCESLLFCATPPHDGSLSTYYKHPCHFCHKLPDNVNYDEGALLEPLSIAVHACRRANVVGGDHVLILGSGPIGLTILMTAKAMGAVSICMTDISSSRLETAKSLGADITINVSSGDVSSIAKKIKSLVGSFPNKTIECSGAESSIQLGIEATKCGGTMALVGLGKPEIAVSLVKAACKEIDIVGVFRYGNCYPIALDFVSKGIIDVKPLISHYFKLEDSLQAFEKAKSGEGIKIIITC